VSERVREQREDEMFFDEAFWFLDKMPAFQVVLPINDFIEVSGTASVADFVDEGFEYLENVVR
jgi:hypothetical protein